MKLKITDYVPTDPSWRLELAAFWIIPDPNSANGRRVVPIPQDIFEEYLLSLED